MNKCAYCKQDSGFNHHPGCPNAPASSGTVEGVVGATFIHPDLKVSFRVINIRPDMIPYIGWPVAILDPHGDARAAFKTVTEKLDAIIKANSSLVRLFIVQERLNDGEWLDDPDQPDDYTHDFEQAKWWMENDNKTCVSHATTYDHRIIERTETQVWPNKGSSGGEAVR